MYMLFTKHDSRLDELERELKGLRNSLHRTPTSKIDSARPENASSSFNGADSSESLPTQYNGDLVDLHDPAAILLLSTVPFNSYRLEDVELLPLEIAEHIGL